MGFSAILWEVLKQAKLDFIRLWGGICNVLGWLGM